MSLSWFMKEQFPSGEKSFWAALWGRGEHIMDGRVLDGLSSELPIHRQQNILAAASRETYLRTLRTCIRSSTLDSFLLLEIGPGSGKNFPALVDELGDLRKYGYVGVELMDSNFQRLMSIVDDMQKAGRLADCQVFRFDSLDQFVSRNGCEAISPGNLVFVNADIMNFLDIIRGQCQFQRALATEVMFYIRKPKNLLRRLQQVLTDDGALIATVIVWPEIWLPVKFMFFISLGIWVYSRKYWEKLGARYASEGTDYLTPDMRKTCEISLKMLKDPEFRAEILNDYGRWSLTLNEPYMWIAKHDWSRLEYLTIFYP